MTPTAYDVVEFIHGYQSRFGWAPSRREIGAHFEIGMQRTQQLLGEAQEQGLVELGARARQVRVMKHEQRRSQQL